MSLLNELRNLRNNPSKIKKQHGICANLKDKGLKNDFIELASQWPKYSGSINFPVPHPKYDNPFEGYFNTINIWDRRTAYGKLRWELLNWAIATLESREQ
mgnify:FL=1